MIECARVSEAKERSTLVEAAGMHLDANRYSPKSKDAALTVYEVMLGHWLEAQNALHLANCPDCIAYRAATSPQVVD
jgi:hypothetical protein